MNGLQPNCWVNEEVVVKKFTSLTIKGIKSPDGLRPIISGNRISRIFRGEVKSKIYLEALDLVNGFVEGIPLYVNKDNPVDGFIKIHGAHIITNGYLSMKDCILSGGYSAERYASGYVFFSLSLFLSFLFFFFSLPPLPPLPPLFPSFSHSLLLFMPSFFT